MANRTALLVGSAAALLSALQASASIITSDPSLPPTAGEYRTPADVHADYPVGANTITLETIAHFGFTDIVRIELGLDEYEQFNSMVSGQAFLNATPLGPITLAGPVETRVSGKVGMTTGTFDTEMLSMTLSGGPGLLVRESPTLPSVGQTTITNVGAGLYQIQSFFDVFTELSLDNGITWLPSSGPTHVELVPEPSVLLLVAGALSAVALGARRVRRAS